MESWASNTITRQMHSDSPKLRRSCLALQLWAAGDLRRYIQESLSFGSLNMPISVISLKEINSFLGNGEFEGKNSLKN